VRWIETARQESAEIMSMSSGMWFLLCVGKFTCWARLKYDRTESLNTLFDDTERKHHILELLASQFSCDKGKGKAEHLYSALHGKDHFKALRHGSHSFTCNKHHACLTS